MPVATFDDWTLAYEDAGTGDAVVFLHGLLMDRSMWEAQARALAGRYRVVAVDAPGHGESPSRPVGFTAEDAADALVAFADSIGIDGPAIWVGHSMGGMAAFRIALRHPQRVRALVLIDTQPFPENPDALAQYDALLEVTKTQGSSEDLAAVVGSIMFGAASMGSPEVARWVKEFAQIDGNVIEGSARLVFDRGDVSDRLGEIVAPTLVVHGTDDTPIPIETARAYSPMIPGATLIEIEGSGHTSPVERPAEVNAAIESFFATI